MTAAQKLKDDFRQAGFLHLQNLFCPFRQHREPVRVLVVLGPVLVLVLVLRRGLLLPAVGVLRPAKHARAPPPPQVCFEKKKYGFSPEARPGRPGLSLGKPARASGLKCVFFSAVRKFLNF